MSVIVAPPSLDLLSSPNATEALLIDRAHASVTSVLAAGLAAGLAAAASTDESSDPAEDVLSEVTRRCSVRIGVLRRCFPLLDMDRVRDEIQRRRPGGGGDNDDSGGGDSGGAPAAGEGASADTAASTAVPEIGGGVGEESGELPSIGPSEQSPGVKVEPGGDAPKEEETQIVETPRQRKRKNEYWEEQFKRLAEFKAKHGNCHVSSTDGSDLLKWSKEQRRRCKLNVLSFNKVRRLESIGFDFAGRTARVRKRDEKRKEKDEARNRLFDERLRDLAAFKEEHGHCRVPSTEKGNRSDLHRWVQSVRYEYNKVKEGKATYLSVEQMTKLTRLGFVFETKQVVPWTERMEACQKFKEENGHLKIPHNHPELGHWSRLQRKQYKYKLDGEKSTLTDERQKQLEDMGFVWLAGKRLGPSTAADKKSWDERLQEFMEFKQVNGHPFVPQHVPGGLGRWVSTQRKRYKRLKAGEPGGLGREVLSPERALLLTEAGFAWDASFFRGRNSDDSRRFGQQEEDEFAI